MGTVLSMLIAIYHELFATMLTNSVVQCLLKLMGRVWVLFPPFTPASLTAEPLSTSLTLRLFDACSAVSTYPAIIDHSLDSNAAQASRLAYIPDSIPGFADLIGDLQIPHAVFP